MRKIATLIALFVTSISIAFSQIDSALAKKITVSNFCLCRTSISDLKKIDNNLQEIEVEEMDLPKKCIGADSRYENGKGYFSSKIPGIIFQKDPESDYMSKIRLTKDFKGNLPDGTLIDLHTLTLKDVFKIYPDFDNKWQSRDCSDYWNITNDTISFFVKIDPNKPRYPLDENYYLKKNVDAIDIKISCFGIFDKVSNPYKKLLNDPVFFVDSVNISELELQEKYQPTDFALVTVYRDSSAIKLIGSQGKDGVIFIETKKFARNKYWNFFKSKSNDYLKVVPTPNSGSSVVYILNNKILDSNYEADLEKISNQNFISLKIINKNELQKDYNIYNKLYGIVIEADIRTKKD